MKTTFIERLQARIAIWHARLVIWVVTPDAKGIRLVFEREQRAARRRARLKAVIAEITR